MTGDENESDMLKNQMSKRLQEGLRKLLLKEHVGLLKHLLPH